MLTSLILGLVGHVFAGEFVLLSVNDLKMNRDREGILSGLASANKIEVIQDSFEINIDPEPNEPFIASVHLIDNKLLFKNKAIKFAVPLDQGNPLKMLHSVALTNSTVAMDASLISIDSEKLELTHNDGMKVEMQHALLECDPEGQFSTAIDEVCFKKARIKTRDSKLSPTVNMTYSDQVSSMNIQLREMGLTEEILLADVTKMTGQYKDGTYDLTNAAFKCHRMLEMLTPYDLEQFLQNCLAASEVEIESLNAKVSNMDMKIDRPKFNLTQDTYQLWSHHLSFVTEGEKSTVEDLSLNCFKLPVEWDKITHYHVIKGCLLNLDSKISEIIPSSEQVINLDGEKIDISEITNVKISVRKGQMIMTGKLKVWFRLNFKLEANITLDETKGELHVLLNNTRVAGMNAKDLALYMIKKFVSGDAIQIDGDNIYIKI
ncbi:MAG: hypothetical protein Fur0010_01030 [Bdellovibrio sp.]